MKFRYIFMLLICFLFTNNALALSQRAGIVKKAYEKLQSNCHNKSYQDKYLSVFPQNADEFEELFDPKDFGELYNWSYEYIQILRCVVKDQPNKTLPLLLTVAKDVHHSSDAPEYLDDVIVYACHKTPKNFIRSIKTFKIREIRKIVNLLADHEAIQWDTDYQKCIDVLEVNNAGDLAGIFKEERALRMKKPHD